MFRHADPRRPLAWPSLFQPRPITTSSIVFLRRHLAEVLLPGVLVSAYPDLRALTRGWRKTERNAFEASAFLQRFAAEHPRHQSQAILRAT